jgi:tRNA-intron endonuclease
MEATIEGDFITLHHSKNLEKRGFGVKRGNRLLLHPVEAVYLVSKGNIGVGWKGKKLSLADLFRWATSKDPDFPSLYFAYEDLRDRGHKIKPVDRYLVGKNVFLPLSERENITMPWLFEVKKNFDSFILAVVDEESEITYYRVTDIDPAGKQEEKMGKLRGYLVRDRVLTDNVEVFRNYFYGNERNGMVSLSLVESLYLAEKGILDIYADKKLDVEEIKKAGEKVEKNFLRRYEVYRDLKERGFVVKTGFKFGSDFRIYEEVRTVKDLPHSKYLVAVVDDRKMPLYEIARAVRLAQNVRKKMVFAFKLGDENRYIVIERIRV